MKEFFSAAFPWVAIGLSIAIILANAVKRERIKVRDESGEDKASGDKKAADNHMTDGMCIGMCIGVVVATTGVVELADGISLGMLLGLTAGLCIKKEA